MLSEYPVFPILLSKDLDATRIFYRDVLGLEVLREDPDDRIVFRCGGGTQLAVTKSTVGTSDTQTQLAWRVPDIHAAVAELRARGVSDRGVRGARSRDRRRGRRHGPLLGGVVRRPEPERAGGGPAETLTGALADGATPPEVSPRC